MAPRSSTLTAEMFPVTPSDTQRQVPPYAVAGPLLILYNASGATGNVALVIKDRPDAIYEIHAGDFLMGIGEILFVKATGTTITSLFGTATKDQVYNGAYWGPWDTLEEYEKATQ